MPPSLDITDHTSITVHRNLLWSNRVIWSLLVLIVAINVPIVLCLHLTADATLFDLQAKCAIDGGVLYQDIVEPNFPGVIWIHMLIRSIAGWSTMMLRAFDFSILVAILCVLQRMIRQKHENVFGVRFGLLALAVTSFYLGLSEWCHCQRDVWMLLPCLVATFIRALRCQQLSGTDPVSQLRVSAGAFLEGTLWAIAFWIKPHIAIPALAVIATSCVIIGRKRAILADAGGLLMGSAALGIAGSFWLIKTGAWEPFWVMQLEWNPQYVKIGRQLTSLSAIYQRWLDFLPWSWFHFVAIGMTLNNARTSWKAKTSQQKQHSQSSQYDCRLTLLMALYVGWTIQVLILQFPFMYVHVAPVFLALAISMTLNIPLKSIRVAQLGGAVVFALMTLSAPILSSSRLSQWSRCISEGSTMEVRSKIQMEPYPDWDEISAVVDFLRNQNIRDEELTVYRFGLIQLYSELQIKPASRFVYTDVYVHFFSNREAEIRKALEESNQRFVVNSLTLSGLSEEEVRGPINPKTNLPVGLPDSALESFPFTQPVVFRSGDYVVHEVTMPLGRLGSAWESTNSD